MPVATVVVAMSVVVSLEVVDLGDAEHVGPQSPAQCHALLLVHHDEFEPDLLDAGNGQGHPVDLVSELVHTRPGGHGESHIDEDTAPSGPHQAHEAQIAEGPSQLGVDDRVDRGLELQLIDCHALPRLGWDPGRDMHVPSRVTPADRGIPR